MPDLENSHKLIAIVGPTGSGKSFLGIKIAKNFNGEIVSADSRQVYRGLNISSGKIMPEEMNGIPHHLLDVADIKKGFSLSQYLQLARIKIEAVFSAGKLPVIVGGTGLYATALLEGYKIPEVPPNLKLRKRLEKSSLEKLQNTYRILDPAGFKKIDAANSRRLIRAIEVVAATKRPFFDQRTRDLCFDYIMIGLETPWEELKQKIRARLFARMGKGMMEEIKVLHSHGVSWKKLESLGLEQKWMTKIIKGETNEKEALDELLKEELGYARRQLTWWRKKPVKWAKDYAEAAKLIREFLN